MLLEKSVSYLAWHFIPSLVREVRVNRACNDLTVVGGELGSHIGESNQLGRTDKSEIEGIKEKTHPLA